MKFTLQWYINIGADASARQDPPPLPTCTPTCSEAFSDAAPVAQLMIDESDLFNDVITATQLEDPRIPAISSRSIAPSGCRGTRIALSPVPGCSTVCQKECVKCDVYSWLSWRGRESSCVLSTAAARLLTSIWGSIPGYLARDPVSNAVVSSACRSHCVLHSLALTLRFSIHIRHRRSYTFSTLRLTLDRPITFTVPLALKSTLYNTCLPPLFESHRMSDGKPTSLHLSTDLSPTPASPSSPSTAPRPSSPSGEPRPEPHEPATPGSPRVHYLPNTHRLARTFTPAEHDERQPLLAAKTAAAGGDAEQGKGQTKGAQGLAKRRVLMPLMLLLLMAVLAGVLVAVGGWQMNRRKHRHKGH